MSPPQTPVKSLGVSPPSRPNLSRSPTPTILATGDFGIPDGPLSTDEVEFLHEFVHPHQHEAEATLVDEQESIDDEEEEERKLLPWWRRPSPWWLIALLPFTAMAMSATIAPKVEIYTMLACRAYRPDIFPEAGPDAMVHLKDDNRPCFSDPVVSAAVAKLAAIITTSTGVLACLTTAWWGSFSDRHGRTRTLGISVLGVLVTDAVFILVYYYSELLPGGYWFLIVGPLCDGALGGMATSVATIHAYMADTSTAASRSRVFSRSTGLMFTGFAFGPTLGGLLIRFSHEVISVFYAAAIAHTFYACMIWFVVPESLTLKKRRVAANKYNQQAVSVITSSGVMPYIRKWFSFLSPLNVFAPSYTHVGSSRSKSPKRDWSLTLVAICYGLVVSIYGSYTSKFQYASQTFGWTSETLSYWLSSIGAARAIFLAIILPLVIKFFKDEPKIQEDRPQTSGEEEPLIDPSNASSFRPHVQRTSSHSPSRLTEPHSSRFDLALARVSLGLEIIVYTLMALAINSTSFTILAMCGALGSGFAPAIQSVALDLYAKRGENETGRLFGALSVLQALSSQILGPAMYGVIYMKTVATFPQMIFFVSVAFTTFSLVTLAFVRLPGGRKIVRDPLEAAVEEQLPAEGTSHGRDRTLVDIDG
ncbi:MFS general substrate transporter [Marasmius fiardii PR-910]|nr:MFS general substrate transporter [Marasmius fiardii PR-910]